MQSGLKALQGNNGDCTYLSDFWMHTVEIADSGNSGAWGNDFGASSLPCGTNH
jgi:hypothetical protein